MRTVFALLAVPVVMVCLYVPPARAEGTVGGERLAGHGYIWDRSSGMAAPPRIQASSYVIADVDTGQVLAAKDPHGLYRPASTLKTLTSITLIPRLNPDKTVKPSQEAVNASGSAVGLSTNWSYTVRDLFYGLLMQSGNDAAIALSEANGGLKPTIEQMNAEARRIQALDTVARTPNGLDDDPPLTLRQQHSSAYDLALIMKQGLKLPDFRKYIARRIYDWPAPPTKKQRKAGKKVGGWQIGTHDHLLLGEHYPGMIGGKNGWTSHALGSFVGAASRNGHTIVISLMHSQSNFWGDARALLNWGFANDGKVKPVGTLVGPVPPPQPVKAPGPPGHSPVATVVLPRTGAIEWWKIALPGAVGVAFIAGLGVGLRRRRRLAVASAPPTAPAGGHVRPIPAPTAYSRLRGTAAEPADTAPLPLPHHPGDVKVAGAPLTPADQAAPKPPQGAPPPRTADDRRFPPVVPEAPSAPQAPDEMTQPVGTADGETTRIEAADDEPTS